MASPQLNKLTNPYLDNDLLFASQSAVSTSTINKNKTDSDNTLNLDNIMDTNNTNNDDDTKQNTNKNEDEILQSILNLDRMDMKSDEYKPIQINVGGIKYESTKSTFLKYPSSTLSKLISNNIYFIDRDGFVFKYILNYLRNNVLILPQFDNKLNVDNEYLLNQLLIEAKYYNLPPLIDELIMMKINSKILSTSSNKPLQKKHIHSIRRLINEEYPKLTKKQNKIKNKNKSSSSIMATSGALNHEWKLLFSYDIATFKGNISPSMILQNKCGGLRSILIIFVAMNQIFTCYFYEPWNEKAYRQKNFFYWIGEYLNDGLHKNKFENFTGKKFKCTYSYKGEIVAQYTPNKKEMDSTLNKDYQIAFGFDSNTKLNNLILTNLKGIPIKALATEKDQIAVSMLEVYHIALK